jgi:hypothetical protein
VKAVGEFHSAEFGVRSSTRSLRAGRRPRGALGDAAAMRQIDDARAADQQSSASASTPGLSSKKVPRRVHVRAGVRAHRQREMFDESPVGDRA